MDFIQFNNVSFKYHTLKGETLALSNLSFSVKEKEFFTIVGPSGCGKSTILNLLTGIYPPTSGEVKKQNSLSIGYMFQRDLLFPWRTILQNVTLGLEIKGMNQKENVDYAKALLEKYGLAGYENAYPSELSGGMKQRAALIRTLSQKPHLLLLDEPTSALDYQTRLNLGYDISKIIKSEGKTAVMVTHDISEAISLSDKVLLLSKRPGRVVEIYDTDFDTSPENKRKNEKFPHLFQEIWRALNENT